MKKAITKSAKTVLDMTPILISILLLIGLINSFLSKSVYEKIFGHGIFFDSIIGGLFGSISAGTPINSYVLGGELLKNGVSLTAVTTFIITWVSVGIIQLPIEGEILGMKFAVIRNISAFALAILVAIIANAIMSL